jgi:hypothetical protein
MPHNTERVLLACSLWLRIGFVGASALAAGVLALLSGETSGQWEWLSALALVFFGGLLAAASWGHARVLLGDAEQVSAFTGIAPREPAPPRVPSKPSRRAPIAMPSAYSAAGERDAP